MTENKQFKNVEEKLDWGTIQYFTYNDEKITDDEIKDLVNQLVEENEQLKQENETLKDTIEAMEEMMYMTEKRFECYEHKGADYILDTPNKSLDFIEMLGDCLEAEEIVDLLNSLNDENEKLKQENNDIKHKIEEIYYTYIYKPSEHYDEDSCDKIIRGILKGVEKR